jgi:phospholipid/cholesterol/gamma-HCH transport system substrate-binding protein
MAMESDKHYFFEGLFIIGLAIAIALAFAWLAKTGHRDDVLYRIHFNESVSGLALGDPVKFQGVDVGTVAALNLDPSDPQRVAVDVSLRKEAPVRTDTRARLELKGITGVVFVELTGGSPAAAPLAGSTPAGQMPEIPSEKSPLASLLESLPRVVEKFSGIETKAQKVLTDVGAAAGDIKDTASKVKENPSLLLRSPKPKPAAADKQASAIDK